MCVCSYLATWHYPVGDSQEGQTYSDPEHCPALHTNGLLPQTRQVLVPDSQQLLLAVGMCNKLERDRGLKKERERRGKRVLRKQIQYQERYFQLH